MKNFLTIICVWVGCIAFGQNNSAINDMIFTADGKIVQAKVTKVSDSKISYSYPGEVAEYEMPTASLEKIVFSSGRTQLFKGQSATGNEQASKYAPGDIVLTPEDAVGAPPQVTAKQQTTAIAPVGYQKKTLAVIPFSYTVNNEFSQKLSTEATAFATDYLSKTKSSAGYKVLTIQQTIDALIAAGIKHQQIKETDLKALQKAVGTQYIIVAEFSEHGGKLAPKKPAIDSFYSAEPEQSPQNASNETEIYIQLFDADNLQYDHGIEFNSKAPAERVLDAANANWKKPLQYLLEHIINSATM